MIYAEVAKEVDRCKQDEFYRRIPKSTIESIHRFVFDGIEPGGFVSGVMTNDLKEAVGRADVWNLAALKEIVTYCHMELPRTCWGSHEKVKDWMLIRAQASQRV